MVTFCYRKMENDPGIIQVSHSKKLNDKLKIQRLTSNSLVKQKIACHVNLLKCQSLRRYLFGGTCFYIRHDQPCFSPLQYLKETKETKELQASQGSQVKATPLHMQGSPTGRFRPDLTRNKTTPL